MAQVRMNMEARERICRKLLQDRFKPLEAKLEAEKSELARRIWEAQYTPEQREMMYSMPMEAFRRDHWFSCNANGERHGFSSKDQLPMFYSRNDLVVKRGDALCDDILRHAKEEHDLKDSKKRLDKEIMAVLRSYTTFEKLLAGWPEIGHVVSSVAALYTSEGVPQLPVPVMSRLNAELGVPPS